MQCGARPSPLPVNTLTLLSYGIGFLLLMFLVHTFSTELGILLLFVGAYFIHRHFDRNNP